MHEILKTPLLTIKQNHNKRSKDQFPNSAGIGMVELPNDLIWLECLIISALDTFWSPKTSQALHLIVSVTVNRMKYLLAV